MGRKWILVFLLGWFVLAPIRAQSVSSFSLFNFQIGGMGAWYGAAQSFFGQVAWTPYIGLGPLGIRGDIGVSSLDLGAGRFMVTNYEILAHLGLLPGFGLEAGGGTQIWHGKIGASLALSANLIFDAIIGVDRLFLGYTRFTGGTGANEVRFGFGFEL